MTEETDILAYLKDSGIWESARRRVHRGDAFQEIIDGTLAALQAPLAELRKAVVKEWEECNHYEHLRATHCDDTNLAQYGPAIIYCGALKWVLAEIDKMADA